MKVFLSSTFLDLHAEREAVLKALRQRRMSTLAMEDFLATPTTTSETALAHLRSSDVMVLIVGFKAGSLLSDGSGRTYTWDEYEELLRLGREALVFLKTERGWFRKSNFPWFERKVDWVNLEKRGSTKAKALDNFKNRVGDRYTWHRFETPDQLALGVIESLNRWEANGRPGARKTFASAADYFAEKNPAGHFKLLDFGTTLLGRDEQVKSLNEFLAGNSRVALLSGRGGIGKSKLLHDWSTGHAEEFLFLKDEPLWHEDSEKEIPIACRVMVVDDAHRQESFGKVLQLIRDTARYRNLKLVVSTRPGSTTRLMQILYQHIDTSQVIQFPDLQELTRDESRRLAEEVLGEEFAMYAPHLAEIGSNSPLVIVAGGRLIANRRIEPAQLTTQGEFRSAIFNRLLDDMELRGPRFPIDSPLPVLYLIAVLGPVDVQRNDFQEAAKVLLSRPVDEILATIDVLATAGILTPRPKPVRVIPDVLADWLVEKRCIGQNNGSTLYADRVYELFGAHSLKNLMRNLAELDWRLGQAGETGLHFLDGIWSDIRTRFRASDEYGRHDVLSELSSAAIYQPEEVMGLVRLALGDPIPEPADGEGSFYRLGQKHVLSVLPDLLEATAHHPDYLRESVGTLWELARQDENERGNGSGARAVLKRLSSWHRYGHPALNFAMLLQAIRLIQRPDALTSAYTPFEFIEQILQRDGEFSEWQDEMTISIGGFGLNYKAVGPVRESALDYLEFVLASDGIAAIKAVGIMEDLLHNYLTRMGRQSSDDEVEWQNRERVRCLASLVDRYGEGSSVVLKARLYDAIRAGTAINCRSLIREAATKALESFPNDDAVAVADAISTAEHNLPVLTTEFTEEGWDRPFVELMLKGKASLERLVDGSDNQARFVIDQTKAWIEVRVATGGFHRFMLAFEDRPDFLNAMADQIIADESFDRLVSHLASVFNAIRSKHPAAFRERAMEALRSGAVHIIHASANNLRVFENATEADVALIQAYGSYPDSVAKCGAIFAVTYMGKFTDLLPALKAAILSIHTEGESRVAAELADAFGPYGVPLTSLTRDEASAVANEFLLVKDWDFDQGAIPRFLGRFVGLFPDETYSLLVERIERSRTARVENQGGFRIFGLVHQNLTFMSVPAAKRNELGKDALARALHSDVDKDYVELFWAVAGYDEVALDLVVETVGQLPKDKAGNLAKLIVAAIPRFVFTNPEFVKKVLREFTGAAREKLVDAFAYQSRGQMRGVFTGDPEEHMARRQEEFRQSVHALPDDPEFDDLARAMRRLA